MKNLIITLLLVITGSIINAQTISKAPIYKDYVTQNLTIQEMDGGYIYFGYQDSDYKSIVVRESFLMSSKEEAIEFMDKLIFLLEMEKTAKDQHITDTFERITLKRYGFNQKSIYIFNSKMKSLKLNLKAVLKIKTAIINY